MSCPCSKAFTKILEHVSGSDFVPSAARSSSILGRKRGEIENKSG